MEKKRSGAREPGVQVVKEPIAACGLGDRSESVLMMIAATRKQERVGGTTAVLCYCV